MRIHVMNTEVEVGPNAKRAIRWLLLPLAVFLATTAVAFAYDTSWISPNKPIQASALKVTLDEVQTRLGAREILLVASSAVTPASAGNTNAAYVEVYSACPSDHPIPLPGGCFTTGQTGPAAVYAEFPYRDASGQTGWKCRFEPVIGAGYASFARCASGVIDTVGAFPTTKVY